MEGLGRIHQIRIINYLRMKSCVILYENNSDILFSYDDPGIMFKILNGYRRANER